MLRQMEYPPDNVRPLMHNLVRLSSPLRPVNGLQFNVTQSVRAVCSVITMFGNDGNHPVRLLEPKGQEPPI